jgi:palmitoyl protein thioesterase
VGSLVRAIAVALVALTLLAGPFVSWAAAEDKRCGEPGRSPCSILRPPEIAFQELGAGHLGPECVVLVGGFDSTSGDQAFDDLLHWINDDPAIRAVHFGDRRVESFRYDTTGPIDRSAEDLGRFVRSLKPACSSFDVVTHSMGGAVADRAFAQEWLSSADGVETYVALSGPHNGATLARALRGPIDADPLVALELSVLARSLGQGDPTSEAARYLARLETPHRTIRGPVAARLRLATDAMVLRRDTVDRRVETREYLPDPSLDELEGHGGVLHKDEARRVVRDATAYHLIVPDERSWLERTLADRVSRKLDADLADLYARLGSYAEHDTSAPYVLGAGGLAVIGAQRIGAAVADAVAAVLPRDHRAREGSTQQLPPPVPGPAPSPRPWR